MFGAKILPNTNLNNVLLFYDRFLIPTTWISMVTVINMETFSSCIRADILLVFVMNVSEKNVEIEERKKQIANDEDRSWMEKRENHPSFFLFQSKNR